MEELEAFDVYGDETVPVVAQGNQMVARVAIYLLLCAAKMIHYIVEQPSSSVMMELEENVFVPLLQLLADQVQNEFKNRVDLQKVCIFVQLP